jgi:hypothetical protein
MKGHSTLVFERDGKRTMREPAEVLRILQAGGETPKTLGQLVRVDAPRQVIDLIQHLPGEEVVEESGTVSASASMGFVILVAALCIAFAAGFKEGYEDGYEAGSQTTDEEGGGDDTDADSGPGGGGDGGGTGDGGGGNGGGTGERRHQRSRS